MLRYKIIQDTLAKVSQGMLLLEGVHWVPVVKLPNGMEIADQSWCKGLTSVAWLLQNDGFFNTTREWEQAWDRHHKQRDGFRHQSLHAAAGPSSHLQSLHDDIPEFSGPQHHSEDFEDCLYVLPFLHTSNRPPFQLITNSLPQESQITFPDAGNIHLN
jgi:hypothetical protein